MFRFFRKRYIAKVLSGTMLFYAFSGLASLLNYAFYPIIGRIVSVGEYGEIQFLISMFNQLAVGFVVLNIIAIIISVTSQSSTEQSESVQTLNKVALYMMTPVVILATIILFALHGTLDLKDPIAIIGLGLAVLVSVPYTTSVGKLQGNGQFLESGIVGLVSAFGKLICSLIFVLLGLGVTGAILGVGVGAFLAYLLSLMLDNNRMRASSLSFRLSKSHLQKIAHIRNQSMVAVFVMASLTVLSVIDTIVSRVILSHADAGQYAAVATTAKIVLMAAMPLMWLALPHATRGQVKETKKYLTLTALSSLLFCVAIFFFGHPIVHLLTGIDAGKYISLSFIASVAMSLCALAFLFGSIMVSKNHLKIVTFSTIAGILAAVLICTFPIGTLSVTSAIIAQAAYSLCVIIGGLVSIRQDS